MIYNIYGYRDARTESWNAPIITEEDKEHFQTRAIRSLARADAPTIAIAKDLVLYELGHYDDEKGSFDIYVEPIKLITLADFIKE